jgi:hypothetical protein
MFLLWLLYLTAAGGLFLFVARWLRRPVAPRSAVVLLGLPILFCLPGFFRGATIFPVDQLAHFPPWASRVSGPAHNPNLNDAATQFAPWAKTVRMAWKEGSLPLRNRWNGCGSPLAADGQSAAFSPFTFAMGPLPLVYGFTLSVALKLFLALTGTWLWLRELAVSIPSAFLGAVAFAFSLTMTPWLLFPHSAVFCLWPWALLAIELLVSPRRSRGGFPLLVAVFSAWILAGHPESACLGVCAVGLFLVGRLFARDSSIRLRRLPTVLSAGVLAAALTAFLWVPQSLAIRDSNRFVWASQVANTLRGHSPHLPGWSLGFVTAVFPTAFGDDLEAPHLSIAPFSPPEMMLAYFGVVGWALGLLILRPGSARQRPEIALLLPMLCGLAVATGAWPVFEGLLSIPLLRLISPPRFFSWVPLFGSALAAFELDRFSRDAGTSRGRAAFALAAPILLGGAILTAFFLLRPLHEASRGLVSVRAGVVRTLVTLAVVTLLLLWVCRSPKPSSAAGILLAATAFGELALQGSRLYRWGDPREWFPRVPMVEFLASQAQPFRVVGEEAAVFPATNIFAGVEEIRTHDPVERRDYVEFLDRTCGYDPKPYFKQIRNLESPALDFLNVRFLVSGDPARSESQRWRRVYSGPDGSVLENTRVLARVFAPDRLRIVADAPAADLPLPEDWSREATLVANRQNVSESNAPAEVLEYRETTNQVRFRARSLDPRRPTVLVTSLVDDGGWSATGDRGTPLQTFRANAVFLALLLPAGAQAVALDYRPPGFRQGLAVSAAAAALVVFILVRNVWKRRTSPVR